MNYIKYSLIIKKSKIVNKFILLNILKNGKDILDKYMKNNKSYISGVFYGQKNIMKFCDIEKQLNIYINI